MSGNQLYKQLYNLIFTVNTNLLIILSIMLTSPLILVLLFNNTN